MNFSKPGVLGADSESKKMPRWSSPISFRSPLQFRKFSMVTLFTLLCSFACFSEVRAESASSVYGGLEYVSIDGERNCVEDFDPTANVNYFKSEVSSVPQEFTITYNNYYKVIENLRTGQVFIAYLCGTQVPTDLNITNSVPVEIPPVTYGSASQTFIGIFYHLAALDGLKYNPSGQTNPDCVDDDIPSPADCYSDCQRDIWANMENPVDIVFSNFPVEAPEGKLNVIINDAAKGQTLAQKIGQMSFVSAFMNREAIAVGVSEQLLGLYPCLESVSRDTGATFMFITFFSSFNLKMTLGYCDNYYCEYVASAGGSLIEFTDVIPDGDPTDFDQNSLTVDEIVNGLRNLNKKLDYLILLQTADANEGPDAGDRTFFTDLINDINELPAQAGGSVTAYDVGSNDAWFIGKYFGAHLALSDIIKLSTPNTLLDDQEFFLFDQYFPQNVNFVKETGGIIAAECTTLESENLISGPWVPSGDLIFSRDVNGTLFCDPDSPASLVVAGKLFAIVGALVLVFII